MIPLLIVLFLLLGRGRYPRACQTSHPTRRAARLSPEFRIDIPFRLCSTSRHSRVPQLPGCLGGYASALITTNAARVLRPVLPAESGGKRRRFQFLALGVPSADLWYRGPPPGRPKHGFRNR